jgi:hypothetical protein
MAEVENLNNEDPDGLPRQPNRLPKGLDTSRLAYGMSQCSWLAGLAIFCLTLLLLNWGGSHKEIVGFLASFVTAKNNSYLEETVAELREKLCSMNSSYCAPS